MPVFFPPGSGSGMAIGDPVTSGTTGSVLFVGAGPVLSQDNTKFFWDDTNFILKAGAEIDLLANGVFVKALYPVYIAAHNNWFAGESGNATLTGPGNTAIGKGALTGLTTGQYNAGIGANTCGGITSGSNNLGMGSAAAFATTSGSDNVAMGYHSLFSNITNNKGVALGSEALRNSTADRNVGIGYQAGYNITTGDYNIHIGSTLSGFLGATTGLGNTIVGTDAGGFIGSGVVNTIIGAFGGLSLGNGDSRNTLIGSWAAAAGISNVIALSDGAGNLKLDYNYTTSATWTSAASLKVTSAVTSGTSITVASTDTGGKSFEFLATGTASGYGTGRFTLWDGSSYAVLNYTVSSNILALNSTEVMGWSSDGFANAAADAGLARYASGQVEVNVGTKGSLGKLVANMVALTDNVTINTTTTGQPIVAISNDTSSTTFILSNTSTGGHAFQFFSTGQVNNPGFFGVYDSTTNVLPFAVDGTLGNVQLLNTGVLAWTAGGSANSTTIDTGLSRTSAGLIEVNSGVGGTLRDLKARSVRGAAVTFANVPASPVEGMLVAVTDSTTVVWGATITGTGGNHVLAYYNGTNWTVAGK